MKNYRDFNNTMNLKKLEQIKVYFPFFSQHSLCKWKIHFFTFLSKVTLFGKVGLQLPPFFLLILKHQIIVVVLAMAHLCQYLLFMWKTVMPTLHFRGKKCISVGREFTKHAQIPVLVPQHKPRSLRSAPIECIRLLSQKNK